MKTLLLRLSTLALSLGIGASFAGDPVERSAPIRPVGDCLVTRDIIEWGVIGDNRLVVKSLGKRYYDIELKNSCRDLNREPYLAFREGLRPSPLGSARGFDPGTISDPVTSDGRICGDLGDAVIPVSAVHTGLEQPCTIGRIQRIDEATYRRVFESNAPVVGQPEASADIERVAKD
ncbi:hypothetical protein [Lysobacter panacisoli]|uniref:Uncharacterized protein n=1 Tax=Lysobacter panacisoli TaxID=1255263 RepID=A0ABP9LNQ4_9GAMM|nr:hypothetical protein [Lysobacter panacisoli]